MNNLPVELPEAGWVVRWFGGDKLPLLDFNAFPGQVGRLVDV